MIQSCSLNQDSSQDSSYIPSSFEETSVNGSSVGTSGGFSVTD